MATAGLQNKLWKRLTDNNFEGIKGTNLSFRLPVHVDLLNSILEKLRTSSAALQDFSKIHFREAGYNQFTVDVNHKRLNKTIRAEIAGIRYDYPAGPVLTIRFLEGIRFYEKFALDSVTFFRKGWNLLKSTIQDSPKEPAVGASWYELTSGGIQINITGLLAHHNIEYLNGIIHWEKILADENQFILKFNIKI